MKQKKQRVQVYLNPDSKQLFEKNASEAGKTLSEYLHSLLERCADKLKRDSASSMRTVLQALPPPVAEPEYPNGWRNKYASEDEQAESVAQILKDET